MQGALKKLPLSRRSQTSTVLNNLSLKWAKHQRSSRKSNCLPRRALTLSAVATKTSLLSATSTLRTKTSQELPPLSMRSRSSVLASDPKCRTVSWASPRRQKLRSISEGVTSLQSYPWTSFKTTTAISHCRRRVTIIKVRSPWKTAVRGTKCIHQSVPTSKLKLRRCRASWTLCRETATWEDHQTSKKLIK